MQVKRSRLEGVYVLEATAFEDARGFFYERYHPKRHAYLREEFPALPTDFEQVNFSRSLPACLRGLHYQQATESQKAQGKLVSVARGHVLEIIVDIRPGSTTFGEHTQIELCGRDKKQVWIPGGFAHGFCVLGDEPVDLLYEVDAPYAPEAEGGIYYNDPNLMIEWPRQEFILSERDQKLPSWATYCGQNTI